MDFKNLDDIIDFAIEKEKEAADFYTGISGQERFSGKKQMLLEFAEQERKHQRLLEDLKAGQVGAQLDDYKFKWITDIKRSDYVEDVTYHPGMGYNELLMLAMKREENALRLYNEMLANAETDAQKKVFKMLCQEEAKHKLSLETMYDDFMAEMGD
ncbi:ferritin-like domain-containing protein [Desulfatitalea alkaliphila]|uniref:Ferritin family protein n=1 Tax=Desulfatitalea alkaliphila TaxID=2929485 RepID=A0AA41UMN1_9BACT|nr:ferritin family protein [Desulfatitalea alkaliphila]MCJ8502801.1 ferritin family protein [Desulfatitalea alkaliphila]